MVAAERLGCATKYGHGNNDNLGSNGNILVNGRGGTGESEFELGYYGWRVVVAACFGVMAGFGSLFVYTFAVFVKPLSAEFGWSREAVSSGFAIAAVTVGLCSPL